MATIDVLNAVKARDWSAANQAFAQTMQQKLADRLAQERKTMFKEDVESWDAATVQRVFDENRDIYETEILMNIENLHVNEQGQVVSFVNKSF
jgi:hypothetical protein